MQAKIPAALPPRMCVGDRAAVKYKKNKLFYAATVMRVWNECAMHVDWMCVVSLTACMHRCTHCSVKFTDGSISEYLSVQYFKHVCTCACVRLRALSMNVCGGQKKVEPRVGDIVEVEWTDRMYYAGEVLAKFHQYRYQVCAHGAWFRVFCYDRMRMCADEVRFRRAVHCARSGGRHAAHH
jgi:hypothetical protein